MSSSAKIWVVVIFMASAVLMAVYFVLFELQNVWQYNAAKVPTLRTITLGAIALSLLAMASRLAFLAWIPVSVAFAVVSILSNSDMNSTATATNTLIFVAVFLLGWANSEIRGMALEKRIGAFLDLEGKTEE